MISKREKTCLSAAEVLVRNGKIISQISIERA